MTQNIDKVETATMTDQDGKKVELPKEWNLMIENFMKQHPGKRPPIVMVNGKPTWLNGKTRRKLRSTKYRRELEKQEKK